MICLNDYITEKLHLNKDSKFTGIKEGGDAILIINNMLDHELQLHKIFVTKLTDDSLTYKGYKWGMPSELGNIIHEIKGKSNLGYYYEERKDEDTIGVRLELIVSCKEGLEFIDYILKNQHPWQDFKIAVDKVSYKQFTDDKYWKQEHNCWIWDSEIEENVEAIKKDLESKK